jgi:hypothetical protein
MQWGIDSIFRPNDLSLTFGTSSEIWSRIPSYSQILSTAYTLTAGLYRASFPLAAHNPHRGGRWPTVVVTISILIQIAWRHCAGNLRCESGRGTSIEL